MHGSQHMFLVQIEWAKEMYQEKDPKGKPFYFDALLDKLQHEQKRSIESLVLSVCLV